MGTTDVTTDGSGQVPILLTLPAGVSDGESVTATATDAAGNTSEFSACVAASCSSIFPMAQTVLGTGPELVWATAEDVRWA